MSDTPETDAEVKRLIQQLAGDNMSEDHAAYVLAMLGALSKDFEAGLAAEREAHEATKKERDALHAQVDRLMLEYCPDEMTLEQIAEWSRHQKVVKS